MSEYTELLRHPRWQEKRLRVLERAGFTCERCGDTERELHAHHKIYLKGRRPWEYADDLLECLCSTCHRRVHEEQDAFALIVAQQPSAVVPQIGRLIDKLAVVMSETDQRRRVDSRNALQDELDAIEDSRRGPGSVRYIARCRCAELRGQVSQEKWDDETFYENGHVADCPLGEVMNEQSA